MFNQAKERDNLNQVDEQRQHSLELHPPSLDGYFNPVANLLRELSLPPVLPTLLDLYQKGAQEDNLQNTVSTASTTKNLSSSSHHHYHPFYNHRLRFLCPLMNQAIGGGIPAIGITEITGTAGSGKTQMVLDLIVQAHLPIEQGGLGIGIGNGMKTNEVTHDIASNKVGTTDNVFDGGCVFVLSTEGKFPSKRMAELSSRLSQYNLDPEQVLHNVILKEIYNYEQQVDVLINLLPQLIQSSRNCREKQIKMVVVDSISGLYRGEFHNGRDDIYKRSKILFTMGRWMQKLSIENKIPFILTNQVTSNFHQSSNGPSSMSRISYRTDTVDEYRNQPNDDLPALGLSWSHCIHTRILLTRREVLDFNPREIARHTDKNSSYNNSSDLINTENTATEQQPSSTLFKREMKLSLSSTVSLMDNTTCQYRILRDRIEGVLI